MECVTRSKWEKKNSNKTKKTTNERNLIRNQSMSYKSAPPPPAKKMTLLKRWAEYVIVVCGQWENEKLQLSCWERVSVKRVWMKISTYEVKVSCIWGTFELQDNLWVIRSARDCFLRFSKCLPYSYNTFPITQVMWQSTQKSVTILNIEI